MKQFFLSLAVLSAFAFAQSPPAQTTQDYASGNRLIINGKPLFISGMNIAWHNFARDVGDAAINGTTFTNNYLKPIKEAGGNAVRWWLHTDAQVDPKMNMSTGAVTGIGTNTINNMRTVLDSAYKYGIVVSMCLFSFDLLQNDNNKSQDEMDRNYKFLTVPENLDSYITNALRPILEAIGSHPAIMAWEVFNEPEGMSTEHGWATQKIAHSNIMRFTSKIAGEVHRKTTKMATTGIHEYSSGELSRYTEAKLKAAGPDDDGYLDFYMVHHYPEYWGASGSPFKHPASYWGMDRPILIGEFPARSWGNGTGYTAGKANETAMTITAAFEYAYDNGYCGAMSWSMTEGNSAKFGNLSTTAPALTNLYNKHRNDIDISLASPASSSSTGSSSGSSSSSEGNTPILASDQMLIASSQKTYYNLKGEPLGAQKPTKPGVYIVKNTKTRQTKKEVVK
uniref:Mannan endo-1,4-beta-mannosidase n=1 Tax=uncultured bacterium contig00029 TaxID=1181518 RepID=A0A806KNG9_9BACT|nr:mannan endo-1,4-beta-mannosidase [uncultured bacterium contig00029]